MKPDNKGSMSKELRTTLRQAAALEIGYLVLNHEYELAEPSTAAPALPADGTVDSVVAAAVLLANQRAAKLAALRSCLQAKNNDEALQLAAELCGLREARHEASNSTSTRKH